MTDYFKQYSEDFDDLEADMMHEDLTIVENLDNSILPKPELPTFNEVARKYITQKLDSLLERLESPEGLTKTEAIEEVHFWAELLFSGLDVDSEGKIRVRNK